MRECPLGFFSRKEPVGYTQALRVSAPCHRRVACVRKFVPSMDRCRPVLDVILCVLGCPFLRGWQCFPPQPAPDPQLCRAASPCSASPAALQEAEMLSGVGMPGTSSQLRAAFPYFWPASTAHMREQRELLHP